MQKGFEGRWLRPASPMERNCEVGHQDGNFLLCYYMSLSTPEPLQEGHVRLALTHLYRKVRCLQVCIAERDGVMWLKEASNPDIDFQVIPDGDFHEVMRELRAYRYCSATGPQWCARLVPDTTSQLTQAHPSHLQPAYPHNHHLFLGLHHGIVDGMAAMAVCGFSVTLLNDVIAGKAINDEQLGEYVIHGETLHLIEAKKVALETDPKLQQEFVDKARLRNDKPALLKSAIKVPKRIKEESLFLIRDLDSSTTNKFLNKCRAEGVSLNSGFIALAHVALVDLLVDNGIVRDTYDILSSHAINARRYWTNTTSMVLGCHVLDNIEFYTDTPINISENFWNFARKIHQEMQHHLKTGTALWEEAFRKLKNKSNHDPREFLDAPLPADFYTSNLGDVTPLVTEGGEHVRVTRVFRSISINKRNGTWSHMFHSFRGHLIHVLDYNTRTVTTQMAEYYCKQLFQHLLEVL